jgi:hypothetical protein
MLMALRRLDERFGQCAGDLISGSEVKSWLPDSDWSTNSRNNLLGYFHNAFNVGTRTSFVGRQLFSRNQRISLAYALCESAGN